MSALKSANLALAFLLELATVVIFVYWGINTGTNLLLQIMLAVGAAVLFMVVWGTFAAPRSRFRLDVPVRLAVEGVLFGLAAIALAATGHPVLGVVFAAVVAVNFALGYAWHQH